MTDRERYNKYCEMYDKYFKFTDDITLKYFDKGYTVYTVFLAVDNAEKGTYFVEIEIGGSPEKYKHIRTTMTESEILKIIG